MRAQPFPFPMSPNPMPKLGLDSITPDPTRSTPQVALYTCPTWDEAEQQGEALIVQVYPRVGWPTRPGEPLILFAVARHRPEEMYVLLSGQEIMGPETQKYLSEMGPYRIQRDGKRVHRYLYCAVRLAEEALRKWEGWTPPVLDGGSAQTSENTATA